MSVPARVPFPAAFLQICDRTEPAPGALARSLAVAPFLPLLLVLSVATLTSRLAQKSFRQLAYFTAQVRRVVCNVTGRCDRAPATVTLARKPS
jgi:hypothetical protein